MFRWCRERGPQDDTKTPINVVSFMGKLKLNEKKNKFHVHTKQGKLVLHLHCLDNFKGFVQV
jgi:hypothetical protein